MYKLWTPFERSFSCIIWESAYAFAEIPILIPSTWNKHYLFWRGGGVDRGRGAGEQVRHPATSPKFNLYFFFCWPLLLQFYFLYRLLQLFRFSYVCSICACLVFSVSSSSSCLGWAAAFPGLFSYLFCHCLILISIMKSCLYNFNPLKPHFYIVKRVYRVTYYSSYFCSKT